MALYNSPLTWCILDTLLHPPSPPSPSFFFQFVMQHGWRSSHIRFSFNGGLFQKTVKTKENQQKNCVIYSKASNGRGGNGSTSVLFRFVVSQILKHLVWVSSENNSKPGPFQKPCPLPSILHTTRDQKLCMQSGISIFYWIFVLQSRTSFQ